MSRVQVLSFVAFSLVVANLASPTPTPSPNGKNIKIIGLENADEEIYNLEPSHITKRELGSILLAIKDQIRDIIEDLILQAFAYCKVHLQQLKVNLLRKIGMYTLADIFHIIFDGVNDFVAVGSAITDDEDSDDKVVTPEFGNFDAYSLAALLAAKRDVN